MITEVANLSINGQAQDGLVPDIVEIEVQEDVAAADVFRVRLALSPASDGSWNYVDDDRFALWNRLSLEAGYPEDTETLVDGYITHLEASFSDEDGGGFLEISGMDPSALMDLEEKQRAWLNKKDSEIAQEVFLSYGLSYEVEDTVVRVAEDHAAVLQAESDIRFLRRLAARNGFECYVQAGKGFFRSPTMEAPPQKTLAVDFGEETNVAQLRVRLDGTPPTRLEIRRVDPLEKQELTEAIAETPRRELGARTLAALRSGQPDGRVLLRQQPAVSAQEMQGRLREAYQPASQFVWAEGEVDSRSYGRVLRAKRLVTIKGTGANFSGLYYVTRVRHTFTVEGYAQHFEAYRNGLGLTGEEDFGASTLPLAVPGGLGNASVAAGNRVLPAQQQTATIPGG
jgi:phage protein D